MKIQLQFEENDLQEMLTEYFKQRGFEVKNMTELQSQFEVAFPGGLKVEAQTADSPVPSANKPLSDVIRSPAPPLDVADTTGQVVPITSRKGGNPRMTASDLFDPDLKGAPSRNELLAENQREIQSILAQSQAIEESTPKR